MKIVSILTIFNLCYYSNKYIYIFITLIFIVMIVYCSNYNGIDLDAKNG